MDIRFPLLSSSKRKIFFLKKPKGLSKYILIVRDIFFRKSSVTTGTKSFCGNLVRRVGQTTFISKSAFPLLYRAYTPSTKQKDCSSEMASLKALGGASGLKAVVRLLG